MTLLPLIDMIGQSLLDFALPLRCPGCGEITQDSDSFCTTCWSKLRFLGEPCCALCGIPFEIESGVAHTQCGPCLKTPPRWDSARAALAYGDLTRGVALRLKYGRRTGLARLMARYMAVHVAQMKDDAGDALLVPVPLHRWRLWSRGFNQSALLAAHIGKATATEVDSFVLKRVKATRPLRAMSPKKRAAEVRGAFALEPSRRKGVEGRTIILIDDVHTSGATARACVDVLREGGAASVHFLSWARVIPDAI